MLVAPLLATFYGQPELTGITRWLAAGFIASGATVQHWALLRRQMRFGTIALLETSAELTAAAIAIALAWHGAGYWALVVQRRSEEHTSELQSLMRTSYAAFCFN